MSSNTSWLLILTTFGFEKNKNGEKITLPDKVETGKLIRFRNFLQDSLDNINNNDDNLNNILSPYEMKMVEDNDKVDIGSFWACHRCINRNPIELNTCQICDFPRLVCVQKKQNDPQRKNTKLLRF